MNNINKKIAWVDIPNTTIVDGYIVYARKYLVHMPEHYIISDVTAETIVRDNNVYIDGLRWLGRLPLNKV